MGRETVKRGGRDMVKEEREGERDSRRGERGERQGRGEI